MTLIVSFNITLCQKNEELLSTRIEIETKSIENISESEIEVTIDETTTESATTASVLTTGTTTDKEKPRPGIYASGLIGYWEHEFDPFCTPITLRDELEQVLLNGTVEEYGKQLIVLE